MSFGLRPSLSFSNTAMQAASADPTCSRRHSAEGPQAEMVKDGHNGSYMVRNMKIREDQSRKSETIPWTQVVEVCVFLITFCNLLVELGNLSHTSAVAELFSIVFPCSCCVLSVRAHGQQLTIPHISSYIITSSHILVRALYHPRSS